MMLSSLWKTCTNCADDAPLDSIDQALKERIKDLGEISIRFYYATAKHKSEWKGSKPRESISNAPVPEKALKGRAISRKTG
jgi:hypothetical protein